MMKMALLACRYFPKLEIITSFGNPGYTTVVKVLSKSSKLIIINCLRLLPNSVFNVLQFHYLFILQYIRIVESIPVFKRRLKYNKPIQIVLMLSVSHLSTQHAWITVTSPDRQLPLNDSKLLCYSSDQQRRSSQTMLCSSLLSYSINNHPQNSSSQSSLDRTTKDNLTKQVSVFRATKFRRKFRVRTRQELHQRTDAACQSHIIIVLCFWSRDNLSPPSLLLYLFCTFYDVCLSRLEKDRICLFAYLKIQQIVYGKVASMTLEI